jgi:hypothetical protein
MTTLRSNQKTLLGRYSLKLLPEPTPKRPHIKICVNRILRRDWIVSCLVKVQLYLVSQSVNHSRLICAVFICTSNCIQLCYFAAIIAVVINSSVLSASTKYSILAYARTSLTTSHQATLLSTLHWIGAENLAPPEFDPPTFQPVASRYTDWAIPAPPYENTRTNYGSVYFNLHIFE